MYKALVVTLTLLTYQFTGVAHLHSLPVIQADTFKASCVYVADTFGSERMRQSKLCSAQK